MSFGCTINAKKKRNWKVVRIWDFEALCGFKESCFAGDTLIRTPEGETRIDELAVGQIVWSWNAAQKELVERPVQKVIEYPPADVYELNFSGLKGTGFAWVTLSHAVLTKAGWKRVGNIGHGDELLVMRGKEPHIHPDPVWIPFSCFVPFEDPEPVYNLRTRGEHTFIANGLVAHNFGPLRKVRTFGWQAAERVDSWLSKQTSLPSLAKR
jgi:hypothetical protein